MDGQCWRVVLGFWRRRPHSHQRRAVIAPCRRARRGDAPPAAIRRRRALSALPKATPVASDEALLRREHVRADRNGRERFRPPTQCGTVAGSISAQADDIPQWPPRRPGPPGHFVPGRRRKCSTGSNAATARVPALDLRALPDASRRSSTIAGGARAPPASVHSRRHRPNEPAAPERRIDGAVEMPESEAQSFLRAG
jgi:hypothetical protein